LKENLLVTCYVSEESSRNALWL